MARGILRFKVESVNLETAEDLRRSDSRPSEFEPVSNRWHEQKSTQ